MMTNNKYSLAKIASYITGGSMAICANLSPILFITFKDLYNISYTLLGFIVVINFLTQLVIDLAFSFFTKYFNIHKCVRMTPLIVFIGLLLYGIMPMLFPKMAYLWIIISTIIFSVASGLSEVLLSPVIAEIPSENPEHEMSKLHSMYAWGVVVVVLISTLYLNIFGTENWMYLAFLWALVPFSAFLLFLKAELPQMSNTDKKSTNNKFLSKGMLLCMLCIFLGGAAECTMAQWSSSFLERAIGDHKVFGDVFGVAFFAMLLGLARTFYSKYGKNIINFMLMGMIGATFCYIIAGVVLNPVICIIACALTGLFTAMLWPGTLIYLEENFTNVSVSAYALMAAGGDMGAAIVPQLVGVVSDKFALSEIALKFSGFFNISSEQFGMRCGIITAAIFPLLGTIVILYMKKYFKNKKTQG